MRLTNGEAQINRNELTFRYSKGAIGIIEGINSEVSVFSSSQQQGNVRDFISKEKVFCWTKNEANSWFAIDFGAKKSVIPTHYTLRYGSSGNNVCPRNWLLQATNRNVIGDKAPLHDPENDPDWVTLKRHSDDSTIDTDFGEHTWQLDNIPSDKQGPYRVFRVIQNGFSKMGTNNDWKNVFVVGGFELFGTVVLPQSGQEYDDEEDEKIISDLKPLEMSDSTKGIISQLGGHERARVMIYTSGLKRGNDRDFISTAPNNIVFTKNEKNSWYAVDFGEKKAIIPNAYQMTYSDNTNFTCPRNWLLQGSNKPNCLGDRDPNSKLWRTLKKHENDSSLDQQFASKRWELDLLEEHRKPYRFFRLIQFDENKSRGNEEYCNIFVASAFELWGVIYERPARKFGLGESQLKTEESVEESKIISKLELEEKPFRFPSIECTQTLQTANRVRCLLVIDHLLYVATDDPTIVTFVLKTGETANKEFKGHSDGVTWITHKKDRLFSSSWDATIKVWDLDHALCIATLEGHTNSVTCLIAFDDYLYSSSDDRTIRSWDLKTFEQKLVFEGHTARITHMTSLEDKIYSCSCDKTVKVWDRRNGKLIDTFQGHKDTVRFLAVEKGRVFSASDDNTIVVRNSNTGKEMQTFTNSNAGANSPSGVALTDDLIYSVSTGSRQILVFDRRTGSLKFTIEGSESNLTWISLGPEGQIFSGSTDGTIKIWDKQSVHGIKTLRGHKAQIQSLFIDDQVIFSGSSDNTLRMWNASTGENLKILKAHPINGITCIAVIDDRVYTGSQDKRLRFWSISEGECIQVVKAHEGKITGIFAVDDRVFTSSTDRKLKMWDSVLLKPIATYDAKKPIHGFKILENNIFIAVENEIHVVPLVGEKKWTAIAKAETSKEESNHCIEVVSTFNQDENKKETQVFVGAGRDVKMYRYENGQLEKLETVLTFHTNINHWYCCCRWNFIFMWS